MPVSLPKSRRLTLGFVDWDASFVREPVVRRAQRAQNDLLEFPVFGLPDLKAVLEELLNIRIARAGARKLTPYGTDVLHPGQDKKSRELRALAKKCSLGGHGGHGGLERIL